MKTCNNIGLWLQENKDICIEALRVYLGVALFLKGLQFLLNQELANEYLNMVNLPFFSYLSVHIVVMVHLAGGFLLAIGLITRIAALIQVPLLFGAMFFVHFQQGLFSREQSLELVMLTLFLLLVFIGYGGGRFSVDYILEKRRIKVKKL